MAEMTLKDWGLWTEGADGADYCQSLYELAKHFKCNNGLEIGVRMCKSAYAFLMANDSSTLLGIDPNPEFPVSEFMDSMGMNDRFTWIRGASPEATEPLKFKKFDWIYIDGRHDYEGVKQDWFVVKDMVAPGGIIVFDDNREGLGYGTDVPRFLNDFGIKYKTNEDFGLTPNPHYAAVVVNE